MANRHLPALLVIMDGFGLAPEGSDNAVSAANTPFIGAASDRVPSRRSMYWRDSPASARSWSSSTRLAKASVTSPLTRPTRRF